MFRLLRECRLVDEDDRIRWPWIVLIVWFPLLGASLSQLAFGDAIDRIMFDAAVHARLLCSVPLLFIAENVLENRARKAMRMVVDEGIADAEVVESLIVKVERARDARSVEIGFAVVVFLGGQAVLWGIGRELLHTVEHTPLSLASVWYATLALPLVQFLTLRWLWRWLLWTYLLVRLSRLPLATNALHPDSTAGLKPLSLPTAAFAVFVASVACVASATWTTKVVTTGVSPGSFLTILIAFIVISLVVAIGPLLLFGVHIVRARTRDLVSHHVLAGEFVREFRRKWLIARRPHPHPDSPEAQTQLLTASDLQSLNDLGGGYVTTEGTSVLPMGKYGLVAVCIGAVVPMIPLALSAVPVEEIAAHLGKLLLGGL